MSNYLYHEFLNACILDETNPTVWAEKHGLSNGTPSYIKRGVRPKLETLKKMTTGWKNKESCRLIAVAYLKDEIERLGFNLDSINISSKGETTSDSTLDDDLKTVQLFMNKKPIRESMHSLAVLLKASEWAQEEDMVELLKQAEDSATMQRARRRKSKTA
ncbi:MAG: hypothetical protein J6K91_05955 [Opitutales bacterium]|nr:hypothetical protein [Opitutales bacterium]MBP3358439.1 hypothetical protein [Opitutales bacterium]